MPSELTNLLPPERIRALTHDYWLRLGVITAWFVTALVLAAAVLLLPTYLLLAKTAEQKHGQLASLQSSFSSADEVALSERLAILSVRTDVLGRLEEKTPVSQIMRAVLQESHPGIALSGFSYLPAVDGVAPLFDVKGTAVTRSALRAYQLALQRASFATGATLPVSVYAKDNDIPFTISITLAP